MLRRGCLYSGQTWLVISVVVMLVVIRFITRHTWSAKLPPPNPQDTRYISATFDIPGLGNLMFQYASLTGIATRSHMFPVMPKGGKLNEAFLLPTVYTEEPRPGSKWGKVLEKKSSSYDPVIATLNYPHNIEVVGFLQSWKYFQEYAKELRTRHFKFRPELISEAQNFLRSSISPQITDPPLFIAVHIRRGDFLTEKFKKFGYTVADKNYLKNATAYFEEKFSDKSIHYIVCSDDIAWSKDNFISYYGSVAFSTGRTELQDLAILANCNHTIMTVGTFGWWAAWLAGGDATYYKNYPKTNSKLHMHAFSQTKLDYFLPEWIPL